MKKQANYFLLAFQIYGVLSQNLSHNSVVHKEPDYSNHNQNYHYADGDQDAHRHFFLRRFLP